MLTFSAFTGASLRGDGARPGRASYRCPSATVRCSSRSRAGDCARRSCRRIGERSRRRRDFASTGTWRQSTPVATTEGEAQPADHLIAARMGWSESAVEKMVATHAHTVGGALEGLTQRSPPCPTQADPTRGWTARFGAVDPRCCTTLGWAGGTEALHPNRRWESTQCARSHYSRLPSAQRRLRD